MPNNTYLCWLQHFETRKVVPAQFVQPWVFERIFNWRSWPQILGGWQITLSVKAFVDFNILLSRFGRPVRDIKEQEDGLLSMVYFGPDTVLHWGLSSSSCNSRLIWREIIFTLPNLTSKLSYHTNKKCMACFTSQQWNNCIKLMVIIL